MNRAHQREPRAPTAGSLDLTSGRQVKELLTRHGLKPQHDLGQNFLVDRAALAAIVAAAELGGGDTVLEIGPGLGVLTRELAGAAGRVVTVELDRSLEPLLQETLAGCGNVELIFADALSFDLGSLPAGSTLVANLPYNVATPIVANALDSGRFTRLVFLVQREVAERIAARPGTPQFGALTLKVDHYGTARIVRHLRPGSFHPPPEVTSSLVRIDVDPDAVPDPELFSLIRQAFAHRRKTLKRNLVMAGHAEPLVADALAGLQLDPKVRAEALPLSVFARLRDVLHSADS